MECTRVVGLQGMLQISKFSVSEESLFSCDKALLKNKTQLDLHDTHFERLEEFRPRIQLEVPTEESRRQLRTARR